MIARCPPFVLFIAGAICTLCLLAGCQNEPPAELPPLTAVPPTPRPTSTRFATATPMPAATFTPVPTMVPSPEPVLVQEGVFFDSPAGWGEPEIENLPPIGPSRGRRYRWPAHNPSGRLELFSARAAASRSLEEWRVIEQLGRALDHPEGKPVDHPWPALFDGSESMTDQALLGRLHFRNGSGLRYVARDAAGKWLYIFQGLTGSGADFVSVIMPVDPGPVDFSAEETAQLTSDAFDPTLGTLDQMISTLFVNLPPPAVEITADGQVPLTLFYPIENGIAVIGHPLIVEGFTQPGERTTLLATLSLGDEILVRETFFSELNGAFLIELPVPPQVQGSVSLSISGREGTLTRRIELVNPVSFAESPEVDLRLDGAHRQAIVQAGSPLFFQGRAANLIQETISLQVLVNGCTVPLAEETVFLPGPGGDWSGYILVPPGVAGEGCAVAATGDPGDPNRRAVAWPIQIVQPGSDAVPLLAVGAAPQGPLRPGELIYVAGTALPAGEPLLEVKIFDEENNAVAETQVRVAENGLWELYVPAPDQSGRLVVMRPGLEGEESKSVEIVLVITPAD